MKEKNTYFRLIQKNKTINRKELKMIDKELAKELNEIKQQNKQILFLLHLLVGSTRELSTTTIQSRWLSSRNGDTNKETKEEFTKEYLSLIKDFSVSPKILNELVNDKQH